jgi:chemotaxis protein MotB
MAKKRAVEAKPGLPAWMGTYGDMVTLLLCFFVLLFSMSSVDVRKFKEAIASFNNQIDIMPGGVALTDGDRINNGVSQLNDIEIIVQNNLPTAADGSNLEGDTDSINPEDMTDAQKEAVALDEAREVYENVNAYLMDKGVRDEVDVSYALNYVKVTIPGETLFDSGQAKIKADAFEVINVLGEMAKSSDYETYSIQIEGHTDNVPINTLYFPSNWELSASRAIAVGKYLITTMGFDEEKIACTGYGEYRPLAPNDTTANKAKNRRVEMKIVLQNDEILVEEYNGSN